MGNRKGIGQTRWAAAQSKEREYWQDVCNNFNEFSRILDEKQAVLGKVANKVPEAIQLVPGDRGKVVEIGIGPLGIGVASLLTPPGSWEIIGVEPLPPMCPSPKLSAMLREANIIPITFLQRRGEDTRLTSDSFDLAICHNVLDHVQNWSQILREINRILKPGGHLILSVDTVCLLSKARWYFWDTLSANMKSDPNIIMHPFKFTAWQLEAMFPQNGFDLVYREATSRETLHRLMGKARRLVAVGRKGSSLAGTAFSD